ncbi:MAG: hypothetical protein V9F01_04015 [Chitinophagaceae bacterium]
MKNYNRKLLSLLALLGVNWTTGFAQAKSGLENYNMLNQQQEYLWMPILHYQAKNGVYTEIRYNYEEVQTLSFYMGKVFSGGENFEFNLTPMLGISTGEFNGISLAINAETEWKNFYLSSQTQYSIATKENNDNFFFSWSELGYSIADKVFAGVAIQYTRQSGVNNLEPGFVGGVEFKNITIPLYVFNPFGNERYFVLGINYEFHFKKKHR